MAITFEKVIHEILNELGAIKGATAADASTNFNASPSTSTVIGPDFVPAMVEPALAATLGETVEAIAATPLHPERGRFVDVTTGLANRATIPRVGSGGLTIIGVPGFVRDAVDGEALLPVDLDKVRSFNRFAATIYSGLSVYWYAKNGNRIEHTRPSNVVIEVCVHERPTAFTGNINLDDWNEGALVAGSVAKLALKESLFAELYTAANKRWDDHLAKIRSYAPPELYGKASAAPSST
jgi:hypothetical protein